MKLDVLLESRKHPSKVGCNNKGNLLNSSDIEYALQDVEGVIDAATSSLMIQKVS